METCFHRGTFEGGKITNIIWNLKKEAKNGGGNNKALGLMYDKSNWVFFFFKVYALFENKDKDKQTWLK